MNRMYSLLTVKAVEDEKRIIRGTATTPQPDRIGDVVEPLGVKFKNPLPLLHQHRSDQPVGTVRFDKPTKDGITFEARLPQIEEPGPLKDRVDTAWGEIKAGLVRAVSIGFRSLEHAVMETGGLRFIASEVLELSLVTIPAQAGATITEIRSIDSALLAASGRGQAGDQRERPGASGSSKSVKLRPKEGKEMRTTAEQIADWEAKRAAHDARMSAIMEKAAETGETLDAEQSEEYDSLDTELKAIDQHLVRLRDLEKSKSATAKAVERVEKSEDASDRRGGIIVVRNPPKPAPGIQFARFARCMILGKKSGISPVELAKQEYGERDPHIIEMVQKANISAVNITTDAALFGNEGGFADYVEFLRNQTIVGRFGQNGIPALRRVPFYFPVVTQATGGTAYWVAEGAAKPMTKPTWTRTELTPLTIAGLAAATLQALRFSSPDAEMALRDDLTAAVVEAIDTAFIDPANAGTAGAKPASITNGISGTAASVGNDADSIRADAKAAMAVFVAAKNPLTSGVWVMSGSNALGLMTMINALGQPEFPTMSVNGGTFMGLPVIVSEAAGTTIVLVNAGDIWLADSGGVNVDVSGEASLQMVDNPTGTSTGSDPVEATLVSMFQTNSVAIRVEKFINWARRRATGVATITAATWGDEVSGS
jgi:HK97 family phage prohead protease